MLRRVVTLQQCFQIITSGYNIGNIELNVSSPLNEGFICDPGIRHDFNADMLFIIFAVYNHVSLLSSFSFNIFTSLLFKYFHLGSTPCRSLPYLKFRTLVCFLDYNSVNQKRPRSR